MGISIEQRLEEVNFRPSGFDYLRIFLAVAVVLFHCFLYSYGPRYNTMVWHSWARGFVKLIVPMFFCLSGFLVAGSMERCKTLVSFIGLRAIRIYPALIVEIFLSALLIGPIVTVLPLSQYFTGHDFFRYLLNASGDISYNLPGVFLHNPAARTVNSQLWTVPFELLCYISLGALVVIGVKKHRIMLPSALAIWLAFVFVKKTLLNHSLDTGEVETGSYLVAFFLAGVGAYLYRDRLPYDHRLTAVAAVVSFLLMGFVPAGDFFAVIPTAYLTVGLGITNPKRIAFIGFADFSYGIYLYGGVIGQLMIDKLPWSHQWYLNFVLTLPVTCFFAMFSWYLIEKPALRMKAHVNYLERAWVGKSFRPGIPRNAA